MKTKRKMIGPVMIGLIMLPAAASAQVTSANNTIVSNDYVGCDANSNQPLRFSTLLNYRHEWRTDNVFRMRLTETLTGQAIGTYGGLNLSGHLGVGVFGGNVSTPFSMIHINNGGSQFSGFRPWHKTGVTFTRGSDLGYVGLKHEGADVNSMALCWADNTLGDGPDRLKFIFLAQPIMANGIAGTLNGLEAVRVAPAGSGNETFFGIGDWFTTGGNADPRERLDILDGRVRIRQLPDDPEMTDPYLVMVVDNTTNPERGVVKWVDPANLPGGNDCDWIVDPNSTGTYDICTAYSGSACPWDNANNVGVGNTNPKAKVDVIKAVNNPLSGQDIGVNVRMATSNDVNMGVNADVAVTGVFENVGGRFAASGAPRTYGVKGYAQSPGGNNVNWAVYGEANGSGAGLNHGVYGRALNSGNTNIGVFGEATTGTPNVNIGVYGIASNASSINYAGYFAGDVYCTGSYLPSDASLKTNVQALSGSLGLIAQLEPRTYEFNALASGSMQLPTGTQAGLMVEDVEPLFPQLVKESQQPALLDTLGNEVHPAVPFKALNYQGLIPYLIGAIQEQQQQIATLQAAVASCCPAPPSDTDSRILGDTPVGTALNDTKLTIRPNPFVDRTMLAYTLDRSGQLLLVVTTPGGRQVQVLREGQAAEGSYTYEWETSSLASGMYYVTLLVDGEVVTKKAVKLGQ